MRGVRGELDGPLILTGGLRTADLAIVQTPTTPHDADNGALYQETQIPRGPNQHRLAILDRRTQDS